MKKLYIAFLFFFTAICSQAQLPWKVKMADKVLLETKAEDPSNSIDIRIKNIKSNKKLTFTYMHSDDESEWKRRLMINDAEGSGILENEEFFSMKKMAHQTVYSISGKNLRKLLLKYKTLKIYYASIPSDPEKAMLVRARPRFVTAITGS